VNVIDNNNPKIQKNTNIILLNNCKINATKETTTTGNEKRKIFLGRVGSALIISEILVEMPLISGDSEGHR